MEIDFTQLTEAIQGSILANPFPELVMKAVSTDTRSIERGSAFFALKGPHYDAHDFLLDAVQKGAEALVISNKKMATPEICSKANVLLVPDTLSAYGDLAKFYRKKFKIPVLAITGSVGKTTVKEMTAHILSSSFRLLKNKGTENNLVGVPKTLLQADTSLEILVLEIGTNQPGEIERLSEITSPQIAMITQIGYSHLEGLKSLEGIKKEKLSIVKHLERGGVLIVNGEDENLKNFESGMHKVIKVGFNEACEFQATRVLSSETGSSFQVGEDSYTTPLLGRHNVLNSLFAVAAASLLGLKPETIQRSLAGFKPVPGRLCLRSLNNIYFIDDSYNSNPNSFKAALTVLKEFKNSKRKALVCGDMLELGNQAEALHREIGGLIAEIPLDFVIAAGNSCQFLIDEAVKSGFNASKIFSVQDSEEAARLCQKLAQAEDVILVKGSRGMKMEKVFSYAL